MQIQSKLIVALMCLGFLLCGVLVFVMQWGYDRGMIHYVNEREKALWENAVVQLARHYEQEGNWSALVHDRRRYDRIFRDIMRQSEGDKRRGHPPKPKHPPHKGRRPPPQKIPFPTLLDIEKQQLIGRVRKDDLHIPITIDDERVGWLAIRPPRYPLDHANLSIKNDLDMALMVVAIILVFCALFVGMPLSRHLVRPLKQIAKAADELTRGNYTVKFDFKRNDEIGSLAKNFEELAQTLKSNEVSRSRWVADISHELRTPVSILLGEIEAMLERIRPINEENLGSLKQEVEQLNHLINDLYELSNAEIGALRYNKVQLDLNDVLESAVQRFEELFKGRGFVLDYKVEVGSYEINADIQRLNQLFNNLFANEIKYASENANIKLSLKENKEWIICSLEDSGPGVAGEHLDKLFDHIYRVEASRNRKTGGSGLGLAICKKIVEAHQGTISASHSSLGGLRITIRFSKRI